VERSARRASGERNVIVLAKVPTYRPLDKAWSCRPLVSIRPKLMVSR
jgi:hypothetical protein